MILYVVYGSETNLLQSLYDDSDDFFICIYNSSIKAKRKNAIYLNALEDLEKIIQSQITEKKFSKIVFVGAAFKTQATLFDQTPLKEISEMIDVNIYNYITITQILLPIMKKMRAGNFIYLSSFRSNTTCRGISVYSASKAFGERFFEIIGKENGAFGIYASSIRMGYFEGRMTRLLSAEKQSQIKIRAGNRRFGQGNDLVSAIKFLINNPYSNGGILDLTGGINHEF